MAFQEWLDEHMSEESLRVIEHPTYDFRPIPTECLEAIRHDILELLVVGETVVLVDSGGQTRTTAVCKHMDFVENSAST